MVKLVQSIELVATSALIPHPRNANQHPDAQVAELAGMIREFGFNVPIVARSDNTILAGHGRLKAALLLGLEFVPVTRAEHLDDGVLGRAFMHADNRAPRLAEIDTAMLKMEIADLLDQGVDMGVLGFSQKEAGDLMLSGTEPAAASGAGDGAGNYTSQFGVIVVCESETHQAEVYDRLRHEGFNCKVVVT